MKPELNFTQLFMVILERKLEEAQLESSTPINLESFMPTVWEAMQEDYRFQESFKAKLGHLEALDPEEYSDLLYRLVEKIPVQTPEQCEFFMDNFLTSDAPATQQFLKPHTSGKFALHFAASHGKIRLITAMVEKLVAIKEDSFPKGTLKTITELQNFYDLPDVRMIDSKPHKKGGTVLHYVALSTHLSVAEKLKLLAELIWDCKANPDARMNGYTFATVLDHLEKPIEGKAAIQQFAKFVEAIKPVQVDMQTFSNDENDERIQDNSIKKKFSVGIKNFKKTDLPWLCQLFFDYPSHQNGVSNVQLQYLLLKNAEFREHLTVLQYNRFAQSVYQLISAATDWNSPDSNSELRAYVDFLKGLPEDAKTSSVCMVLAISAKMIEQNLDNEKDNYKFALIAAEREVTEYRTKLKALASANSKTSLKHVILEDSTSLKQGMDLSLKVLALVKYILLPSGLSPADQILFKAELVTIHREYIDLDNLRALESELAANDDEVIKSGSFQAAIAEILSREAKETLSRPALQYAQYYDVKGNLLSQDANVKVRVMSYIIWLLVMPTSKRSLSSEAYRMLDREFQSLIRSGQGESASIVKELITEEYLEKYVKWRNDQEKEPKLYDDCTPETIDLLAQVLIESRVKSLYVVILGGVAHFVFQYLQRYANTNTHKKTLIRSLNQAEELITLLFASERPILRIRLYYGMMLSYIGETRSGLQVLELEKQAVIHEYKTASSQISEDLNTVAELEKYLNTINAYITYARLQHAQVLLNSEGTIAAYSQIQEIITDEPMLASWVDPEKHSYSRRNAENIEKVLKILGWNGVETYKETVYKNKDTRISAWLHNMLGQLYEATGKFDEAFEEYQIAAGLLPIHGKLLTPCIEGLYNVARHYEKGTKSRKSEPQLSVRLYWQASKMGSEHPVASKALAKLQKFASVVVRSGIFKSIDAPQTALAKIYVAVKDIQGDWVKETLDDAEFLALVVALKDPGKLGAIQLLKDLVNHPAFNEPFILELANAINDEEDHPLKLLPVMIQYALLKLCVNKILDRSGAVYGTSPYSDAMSRIESRYEKAVRELSQIRLNPVPSKSDIPKSSAKAADNLGVFSRESSIPPYIYGLTYTINSEGYDLIGLVAAAFYRMQTQSTEKLAKDAPYINLLRQNVMKEMLSTESEIISKLILVTKRPIIVFDSDKKIVNIDQLEDLVRSTDSTYRGLSLFLYRDSQGLYHEYVATNSSQIPYILDELMQNSEAEEEDHSKHFN